MRRASESSPATAEPSRCIVSSTDARLKVRANRIVLSAGAVASSILLSRSGLGGKQVGKHLGFNAASPMTAEFDEELHSERGLQMTNYVVAPDGQDYALETWFNPIASQALFMPGWFEQHRANMLRYPYMTSVGAVVGTRRNAKVTPALVGGGVSLDYTPGPGRLPAHRGRPEVRRPDHAAPRAPSE